MQRAQQRVLALAIQTKNNELILATDSRVKFVDSDLYGAYYEFHPRTGPADRTHYSKLIEVMYDIPSKLICEFETIEYKPTGDKVFQVGKEYFHETEKMYSNRKIAKSKLKEIIYEEFEQIIDTGAVIQGEHCYCLQGITDINTRMTYCLKVYKPTYVFEDGFKTTYTHQLFTV